MLAIVLRRGKREECRLEAMLTKYTKMLLLPFLRFLVIRTLGETIYY
jgi:hypothetical protein